MWRNASESELEKASSAKLDLFFFSQDVQAHLQSCEYTPCPHHKYKYWYEPILLYGLDYIGGVCSDVVFMEAKKKLKNISNHVNLKEWRYVAAQFGIHSYKLSLLMQGVLAEMDEHVKHLQEQLDSREAIIQTLSSTMTGLTDKMDHLLTSNKHAEQKIGNILS